MTIITRELQYSRVRDPKSVSSDLPITRVDMIETVGGVMVTKFEDGWTMTHNFVERYLNRNMSLEEMVSWFAGKHQWTVRTWPKGARAFYGKPQPIRTKNQIIRLRKRLQQEVMLNQGVHPVYGDTYNFELLYDLP